MKWAIVTPSYDLDFDQCELMCESVDTFVHGDWHHYVCVNKVDYPLFEKLNGPRRTILLNSKVLPQWLRYIGKLGKVRGGSMWFSFRTGIIFGWHLQQIVKLNLATVLDEEMMLLVDSDIFFARRLDLDSLAGPDGITFCRVFPPANDSEKTLNAFNYQSKKTLGLPANVRNINSAHALSVWHRKTILEMCNYISRKHKKHWIKAIFGYRVLSEGTLYGLYIENIFADRDKFTHAEIELAKGMRLSPPMSESELHDFFGELDETKYAYIVPSPIRFDAKELRKRFILISDSGGI